MRRNNLSSVTLDNNSLRSIMQEVQRNVQDGVAAELQKLQEGGAQTMPQNPYGVPNTLSQEYLQFVDGIDEVPMWLRREVWGLLTRHNQLTYIDGEFDFGKCEAALRSILRPLRWSRKITLQDMQQISHYVGNQLRKSRGGRERRWIAPGYQDITKKEIYGDQSVINEQQKGIQNIGAVDKLFNRR